MEGSGRSPDGLLSWMGALADPTRLRLLRLLERHELGVVELCDVLQLPQSTVSRHLKVLSDEGFVENRRQKTTSLYRMGEGVPTPARKLWQLTRDQTASWPTLHQDELRLARRLRQRQEVSQAFFAGAAGEWDRLRGELYGRAFSQTALRALLPPDWVVADLGCGTGQVVADLAPHVARVVGVDQSAAMLKAARRRTAHLENVELHQGDLMALPLDAGACDAALVLLALTYVAEPGRALAEMARVLKPGGRAVVVDLLRHDREDFRREMGQSNLGFEEGDLTAAFQEAGLADVRCTELTPEPGARGPALILASATRAAVPEKRRQAS